MTVLQLRPYQAEAVERAVRFGHGIIQAPTGSGKSAVIAGIIERTGGTWLLLVHRRVLRKQLADALRRFGIKGVVEAGRGPESLVVVSTWQSLYARLKRGSAAAQRLLARPGLVLDECHVAASPCLSRLLETSGASFRFGLSATPLLRSDGQNHWTEKYFGGVIYRIGAPVLAKAGMLARPRVRFAPFLSPVVSGGYSATIVRNEKRNWLLAKLASRTDPPALVLVNHLEHGRQLLDLLTRTLRVRFLHGEDSDEDRSEALRALSAGELEVLIATPIFDVGVDIPELRSVVVASGGSSAIACIQRLGRAMRPAPGKTGCDLWDVADHGSETLERNAAARAEAYSMAGFEVDFAELRLPAADQPPAREVDAAAQPGHGAARGRGGEISTVDKIEAFLVLGAMLTFALVALVVLF